MILRGANPSAKLAMRAKASACWFSDRGKCWILNEVSFWVSSRVLLRYILMLSSLSSYSPETCPTISYAFDFASMFWAPALMQICRPRIRVSYSASLFEARKSNFIAYSIFSPREGIMTRPASLLDLAAEPSTCKSHDCLTSMSCGREWHSLIKSAKAWDLITHRDSVIRVELFLFSIIFLMGCLVRTLIGCAWKYGFNFRLAIINANTIFSIGLYLAYAPYRRGW